MHYATLSARKVADAMHHGVISCAPETPVREAARTMARFRVHALVVVAEAGAGQDAAVWGVVSDLDLLAAIDGGDVDELTAGGCARTPLLAVRRDESLRRAAHLMREHGTTHAVVVATYGGPPVGMLSSLDLVRALAAEPEAA